MSVTFQLSPGAKMAPVIASLVFDQLLTPSTPLTIVKFLGLGRHTPYLLVALQKLHWDVLVRALELPCNRHKGGMPETLVNSAHCCRRHPLLATNSAQNAVSCLGLVGRSGQTG
jgi:hypothetical protein